MRDQAIKAWGHAGNVCVLGAATGAGPVGASWPGAGPRAGAAGARATPARVPVIPREVPQRPTPGSRCQAFGVASAVLCLESYHARASGSILQGGGDARHSCSVI
jgi:hypothetical protein